MKRFRFSIISALILLTLTLVQSATASRILRIYTDQNLLVSNNSTLDWASVPILGSFVGTGFFTNVGTENLTIESWSLSGAHPGDFTLAIPTNFNNTVIPPGDFYNVAISFHPSGLNLRTATLTISTNATSNPTWTIYLQGTGDPTPTPTAGQPYMYIGGGPSGSPYTFGPVRVNQSRDIVYTIHNYGTGTLDITNVFTNNPAFTSISAPSSVPPNSSLVAVVRFSPTATVFYGNENSNYIHFTTNDLHNSLTYRIYLHGIGWNPLISVDNYPHNSEYVFPPTPVYVPIPRTFTIRNRGNTYSTISANTDGPFSITVQPGNPLRATMADEGSTTVTVQFNATPPINVEQTGTLYIYHQDVTIPNPYIIRLRGTATSPVVTVNPTSWNFGSVRVGETSTKVFAIDNSGSASSLSFTPSTLPAHFAYVTPLPTSIPPNSNLQFRVRYTPTTTGAHNTNFSINTQNRTTNNVLSVNLSGTGYVPIEVVDYPRNSVYNFGAVRTSNTQDFTFTIQNQSGTNSPLSNWNIGGDFSYPTSRPTQVNNGQSVTFTVRFSPSGVGVRNGFLSFQCNDPINQTYQINLTGTGTTPIEVVGYPRNSSYNFGHLRTSHTQDFTFTIENQSGINSPLTNWNIGGDFSYPTSRPTQVDHGQSVTFTVRFSPSAIGDRSGSLSFTCNDPDNPTYQINLSGTGYVPIEVVGYPRNSVYNFGNVSTCAPQDFTFTIENQSGTNSSLSNWNIGGDFSYPTSRPTQVDHGQSVTFTVRFSPSTIGVRNGSLSFTCNDPVNQTYLINLTGTGTQARVSVANVPNGGGFHFGSVYGGQTSVRTLNILNTGNLSADLAGYTFLNRGEFSLGERVPTLVSPMGSASLDLECTANTSTPNGAMIRDTLTFQTGDCQSPVYVIHLSAEVRNEAVVVVGGDTLFDVIEVNQSQTNTIILNNIGNLGASLSSYNMGGDTADFQIVGSTPTYLNPYSSVSFSVEYHPTSSGNHSAAIYVLSNDSINSIQVVEIHLSGTARVPSPTNGRVTQVTPSTITLAWDYSYVITNGGFHIYRSLDNFNYALAGSNNQLSFCDSLLMSNRKYWYRIFAYDNAGSSLSYTATHDTTWPIYKTTDPRYLGPVEYDYPIPPNSPCTITMRPDSTTYNHTPLRIIFEEPLVRNPGYITMFHHDTIPSNVNWGTLSPLKPCVDRWWTISAYDSNGNDYTSAAVNEFSATLEIFFPDYVRNENFQEVSVVYALDTLTRRIDLAQICTIRAVSGPPLVWKATIPSSMNYFFPNSWLTFGFPISFAMPVEMAYFRAIAGNHTVNLIWRTESETNNLRFQLYRSTNRQERGELIAHIPGHGTSATPNNYNFTDNQALNQMTYYYRISSVDVDGQEHMYPGSVMATPTETTTELSPLTFGLFQNYPNPFNSETKITYSLPQTEIVNLLLYDVQGGFIKSILRGVTQEAGTYTTTLSSEGLASGIYYVKLSAGKFVQTRKVVLLR